MDLVSEIADATYGILQWCDTPGAVTEIVESFERPNPYELADKGCHWVPAFMPIPGKILEIVTEYFLFGKLYYLVKVELQGNFEKKDGIGYTLIRGPL